MWYFPRDPPCTWQGQLLQLITIVGLLCTFDVPETEARPDIRRRNVIPSPHLVASGRLPSRPVRSSRSSVPQNQAQTDTKPVSSLPLDKRFCSYTHTRSYTTGCEDCSPYAEIPVRLCDPGYTLESLKSCVYIRQDRKIHHAHGCIYRCQGNYTTRDCCQGLWGDDCNEECPGGRHNPCNGHGKCSSKTGACACEARFEGTSCELCTDPTKYGPKCSQDCTCENGICNNGIFGDGLCTQDSPCHSSVPVCGANSQCIHTGPGSHTCACNDGYAGDGTECAPINPCQNNSGGCDVTTDCIYTGPNQHRCQCKQGYEGYTPGKGCKLKDMCTPGLCGAFAVCETREPLKHSCVCKEGYSWNGAACSGNIIERLKELNTNDSQFNNKLQYMINITTQCYGDVLARYGPFTIFVPTDEAFVRSENNFQLDYLLMHKSKLKHVLHQHIVAGVLRDTSSGSFYNLQGNLVNLERDSYSGVNETFYRVNYENSTRNSVEILKGNLEASNGVIHIIEDVVGTTDTEFEDEQKTIMDLLKNHPDYTTMYSMIMAAGLSAEFSQQNTTVLIPNNKAWDSPLLREKHYLMYDEDGLIKLRVILLHHVFPGIIDVTDLIRTQDMKSYANINVKVKLSNQGQVQLDDIASIIKTNIPVRTGLCHRVDKVNVPSYLIPLVNNTCEVMETKKVQGPCSVNCLSDRSCPLSSDTPTTETVRCPGFEWPNRIIIFKRSLFSSRMSRNPFGRSFIAKCSIMCLRKVKKRTCCKGFYGRSCIPCPGSFKNPCSGNGKCSDNDSGTGQCSCKVKFSGANCQLCAQNNTFGRHCNESCTCQFGQCDTGIYGSGKCKPETCQLGYTGENCDKKLLPCDSNEPCPMNSTCYMTEDGVESCFCAPGYENDGNACLKIDLCADTRNPCHKQAKCSNQEPSSVICKCNNGWHGDGLYCMPNHPCDGHTDCHQSAVCQDLEPGQYRCVCKTGYEGNGLTCRLVDPCVVKNGGCYPQAQCTFIKEGERNCTCPDFTFGDGVKCTGTIAVEIMKHPDLTRLRDLMKIVNNSNNMLSVVNKSYTFFAPADSMLKPFVKNQNRPEYWNQEENVLSFLNFHTISDDFFTDDLMALDGVFENYPTLYNGFSLRIVKTNKSLHIFSNYSKFAVITKANIPAFNGVFHIVDQVLEPFLPDSQEPSLNESLSSHPQYQLFYEALQKTNLLEALDSLDEYTLFVLPNHVFTEINRKITAEFLKYYVVPKRLFTPSMSDGNVNTLLGPLNRLSFTVFPDKVLVNGVRVTHHDILTDVGVIHELEHVLHPVLNRCDFNNSNIALGPCGDCTMENLTCPDGFSSFETPRIIEYTCHFLKLPAAKWEEIGCQQFCINYTSKSECCAGYYGPHCDECPGSAENPCSGNGICDEGEKGSGRCKCNRGFSGELCESCKTTDLVPPYCNTSYNSCGYMNGNCSQHARCKDTRGGVTCQCSPGYQGDGHTCTQECDSVERGGCHPQAKCAFNTSEQTSQCECNPGFHGNGTWCQPNSDPCSSHNGGCDVERATCHFIEPKVTDMDEENPVCKCKSGYVGDGKLCSTDLLDAVNRMPSLSVFRSWLKTAAKKIQTYIAELFGDRRRKMTVFIPIKFANIKSLTIVDGIFKLPNDPNIEDEINSSKSEINSLMDNIKKWTLKSLNGQVINVTLNGQGMYLVNGVRIVQGNIETQNGILHLTAAPLTSSVDVIALKSTAEMFSNSKSVIVGVTVAVAILIALITVVIYKKRHYIYTFRHSSTNQHTNVTFSKLTSQEGDSVSLPDGAQFENPLFKN
ncbi:hypothetical protein BsWGS_13724 [Bradybaena similaris]